MTYTHLPPLNGAFGKKEVNFSLLDLDATVQSGWASTSGGTVIPNSDPLWNRTIDVDLNREWPADVDVWLDVNRHTVPDHLDSNSYPGNGDLECAADAAAYSRHIGPDYYMWEDWADEGKQSSIKKGKFP